MAGVARFIGKVAGVVATVATVLAVVTGNPVFAAVAAIASVVSTVALTAAALMAKRPPARGSPNSINIGANMPSPIVLGRTYLGGHKIHDVGYGGKVSKVQNPYSWGVFILSACAPIQAVQAVQADFTTVNFSGNAATGYYAGFLYRDAQLGTLPEPDALTPQWSGAPGWGASYKLSGYGAVGISMRFDKDGKVFSAGEPQWGFLVQGVKAYDWRKDSTFPGGMGSQRLDDRSTWGWTENPALIAAQYARGWWANGKKQGGVGIDFDGLYIDQWTAFANVCDANGWKCGGVIYEPGNRWENIVRICDVGSARPYFEGHRLGVYFDAPRVAIDTITKDDLADDELSVVACRTYRDRVNVIVPKYRSESHKWEYVAANDVSIAQYVTDDGEEKREEIQWDLCQDKDQAAKLAAYELMNRREIGPIEVTCKPRLIRYSAGDMLTFDLPGSVLDGLNAVIVSPPAIDPESGKVKLVMMTDAAGKHDYALGRTGIAPPTPALTPPEYIDLAALANGTVGASAWDAGTLYDFGRVVVMPDGSTWQYTGDVSSSGNEPQEGSLYWTKLSAHVTPGWVDIVDSDPARPKPDDGADVTGENTSKDTQFVAGVESGKVITDLNGAKQDVLDLQTVFGDTASAAASAAAAALAKQAAEDAQWASEQHEINSRDAKNLAEGAAGAAHDDRLAAEAAAGTASNKADVATGAAAVASSERAAASTAAGVAAAWGASQGALNRNIDFSAGLSGWLRQGTGNAVPTTGIDYRTCIAGEAGGYLQLSTDTIFVSDTDELTIDYMFHMQYGPAPVYIGFYVTTPAGVVTLYPSGFAGDLLGDVHRGEIKFTPGTATALPAGASSVVATMHLNYPVGGTPSPTARPIAYRLGVFRTNQSRDAAASAKIAETKATEATGATSAAIAVRDVVVGLKGEIDATADTIDVVATQVSADAASSLASRNQSSSFASQASDDAAASRAWSEASAASATDASAAKVAAQATLSLIASAATDAINPNATFTDWPVGQANPTGWVAETTEGDAYRDRRTSTNGGNAVFVSTGGTPTANVYDTQTYIGGLSNVKSGPVIFAADFIIHTGSANGAALLAECYDDAGVHLGNRYVSLGDEIPVAALGQLYRVRKLVSLDFPTLKKIKFYRMSNWAGVGASGKSMTWERACLMVPSEAEAKAFTAIPALEASNASHSLAIVDLQENKANASNVTALATTVDNHSAKFTTQDVVLADLQNNKASAQSVQDLTTTVGAHTATLNVFGSSIDGLKTQYGFKMTVNGVVSGMVSFNDGSVSKLIFQQDQLNIQTSDGLRQLFSVDASRVAFGTDIYTGSHRIICDNGAFMKVTGTGFGSANQFIEWSGPSMAVNACTEANAITYLKTNGDAYWGGSLSAGTIKNDVRTTINSASASVETGAFTSLGHTRNVVLSFNYLETAVYDGSATVSGTPSATVVLERSPDGDSWTVLTTMTVTGSASLETGAYPEYPNRADFQQSMSRSTTFNDTSGGTSLHYRARVTARTLASVSGGTSIGVENAAQDLSLISIET